MARRINLTLTYLIITTMILSGIQAMLPALGHEWYSQNEQNFPLPDTVTSLAW